MSPNDFIAPELIDVQVLSPSLKPVKVEKESIPGGTQVKFLPEENGPHTVGCWIQDQPVNETPCIVKSVPAKEIPALAEKPINPSTLSITENSK